MLLLLGAARTGNEPGICMVVKEGRKVLYEEEPCVVEARREVRIKHLAGAGIRK